MINGEEFKQKLLTTKHETTYNQHIDFMAYAIQLSQRCDPFPHDSLRFYEE